MRHATAQFVPIEKLDRGARATFMEGKSRRKRERKKEVIWGGQLRKSPSFLRLFLSSALGREGKEFAPLSLANCTLWRAEFGIFVQRGK